MERRYRLDEEKKVLTLHLDASSYPNWDGTTQTRPIAVLTDDVLTWITPVSSARRVCPRGRSAPAVARRDRAGDRRPAGDAPRTQ